MIRKALLTVLLLVGVSLLVVFGIGSASVDSPPSTLATPGPRVHPVQTVQVELQNRYAYRQSYTGEVVARRSSELGFERMGRLAAVEVREGERLEQNAVLARLDTDRLQEQRQELQAREAQAQAKLDELVAGPRAETIAAAEATVRDLTHQLELLKQKQDRREQLLARSGVAREEWDEVVYGAKSIEARLAVARHQLDELKSGTREEELLAQRAALKQAQSLLAQNEIEINKSILRAPYTGTVIARTADEGQVVPQGQPILTLIENASPEVWIGVPVRATKQMQPGRTFDIQVNGATYSATASAVLPQLDSATRTMTAIFSLDGATIQDVPANHTARLELTYENEERGFWLPMSALIKGIRGLWSCFRLVEAQPEFAIESAAADSRVGKAERCDVEVLYTDGDRVYVRGALDEGDLVVGIGPDRIAPGQWVYSLSSPEQAASP